MLHGERNTDRNRRHGDGEIGQQHSGNLITAPAHAVRAFHNSLGHQPSHRESKITDAPSGNDHHGCIKNEPQHRGAGAQQQPARKCRMAIGRLALARLAGAFSAGHLRIDTKIFDRDRITADAASLGSRDMRILGG